VGHPTLINNVETYANVAPIVRNGGSWYASIGTEKSKGTKVFATRRQRSRARAWSRCLMGMPLREIIFDIGGGIPGGKKFKAAQTAVPPAAASRRQFLDPAGRLRVAGGRRLESWARAA